MMREENCGSCRFFRRSEPMQSPGLCKVGPGPTLLLVGMGKHPITGQQMPITNSYWPQTSDVEWCGAWQVRPAMAAQIDLGKLDVEELEGRA